MLFAHIVNSCRINYFATHFSSLLKRNLAKNCIRRDSDEGYVLRLALDQFNNLLVIKKSKMPEDAEVKDDILGGQYSDVFCRKIHSNRSVFLNIWRLQKGDLVDFNFDIYPRTLFVFLNLR